jgi:hypothetical protein
VRLRNVLIGPEGGDHSDAGARLGAPASVVLSPILVHKKARFMKNATFSSCRLTWQGIKTH